MSQNRTPEEQQDLQFQKNEWRRKSWSIPDLRGGKQSWFPLVVQLMELVSQGRANDLDSVPKIDAVSEIQTWRVYVPFLRGIGLVANQSGKLMLTELGKKFCLNATQETMADILQDHVRLFGETLALLKEEPLTVEGANESLCRDYQLEWKNLSNIRRRMDWLEVLDLIRPIGSRKREVTDFGREKLGQWTLVSAEALKKEDGDSEDLIAISEPPEEIAGLLCHLRDSEEMQKKRSTYNIWVPSPNKIENLRVLTQFATEKITKEELFEFIETTFHLKKSSVDSMLPFLKVSGLLEEVGRSVYVATPAARAWLDTGSDLDFIRILHVHMRFVGEVLSVAEQDMTRNQLYAEAKKYGLNAEKARWITGFLMEAGLVEEPQYLHIKTSVVGKKFVQELPLAEVSLYECDGDKIPADACEETERKQSIFEQLCERLEAASVDPTAEGKNSGFAFEEAIADIFSYMGFDTKHIGGSGDTDVVVRWTQGDENRTAIVDAKSRMNGLVSHTDISDVAIDTHKEKNHAEYAAIVGAEFSGKTLSDFAKKKGYALLTVRQLIEIAKNCVELGLSLPETAQMFEVPNGMSDLEEILSARRRHLEITTKIIEQFKREQDVLGDLSPRDLFLLLHNTAESPAMEELLEIFEELSAPYIGMLEVTEENPSLENRKYKMRETMPTVNRLRALAQAIEQGSK